MKASVLFVRGADSVAKGYIDALRYLGHKVYVCEPQTKTEIHQLIDDYGVRFIFTESKHGIRQLPIDTINHNQVAVIVRALPLNDNNLTLGDSREHADPYETKTLSSIRRCVVWTPIFPKLWPDYMHGWLDANIDLLYLPYAGNLFKSLPKNFQSMVDVAIPSAAAKVAVSEMIIRRMQIFNKTFGDCDCNNANVCLNLHPETAFVNESTFTIPISGGIQIVFSQQLVKSLFGDYVDVATSPIQLVSFIDEYVNDPSLRFKRTKDAIEWISINHSYLNRLCELFTQLFMPDRADESLKAAHRLGGKHSWELKARLDAAERGEDYETANIAKLA